MANNVITIQIDFNSMDGNGRYKYYTDREDFYSSPEFFKAYQNYRKGRNGGDNYDPLKDKVEIGVRSVHNAIQAALRGPIDKEVIQALNKAMDDFGRSLSRSV